MIIKVNVNNKNKIFIVNLKLNIKAEGYCIVYFFNFMITLLINFNLVKMLIK